MTSWARKYFQLSFRIRALNTALLPELLLRHSSPVKLVSS